MSGIRIPQVSNFIYLGLPKAKHINQKSTWIVKILQNYSSIPGSESGVYKTALL